MTTNLIKQLREATYASYVDCAKALQAYNGDYEAALDQLRSASIQKAEKKAERDTDEGLIVVKRSGNVVCAVEMSCETDFVALTSEFKSIVHHIADQILADDTLTTLETLLPVTFMAAPEYTVEMAVKQLAGKLGENVQIKRIARYASTAEFLIDGFVHAGVIDGYGPQEGRLSVLIELSADDLQAISNTTALNELAHDLCLHVASGKPTYVSVDHIPNDVLEARRAEIREQTRSLNKPEDIKAKIIEGRLSKYYQEECLINQAFIKDETITVERLLQQKSKALGTTISVLRFTRFSLDD